MTITRGGVRLRRDRKSTGRRKFRKELYRRIRRGKRSVGSVRKDRKAKRLRNRERRSLRRRNSRKRSRRKGRNPKINPWRRSSNWKMKERLSVLHMDWKASLRCWNAACHFEIPTCFWSGQDSLSGYSFGFTTMAGTVGNPPAVCSIGNDITTCTERVAPFSFGGDKNKKFNRCPPPPDWKVYALRRLWTDIGIALTLDLIDHAHVEIKLIA